MNWKNPDDEDFYGTKIIITDSISSNCVIIDSSLVSYVFNNGKHGTNYTIIICALNKEGLQSSTIEENVYFYVFQDFSSPVVTINIPDDMEITTKEWLLDSGMDYAKMSIYDDVNSDLNISDIDIDIKGRGNYSWNTWDKKPFKIKMTKGSFGIDGPKARGEHLRRGGNGRGLHVWMRAVLGTS